MLLAINLGPFAGFILSAYAVTALVIGVLIVWLVLDGKRQARALADLEQRGIRRRSS